MFKVPKQGAGKIVFAPAGSGMKIEKERWYD
jgi:hypothetical protein